MNGAYDENHCWQYEVRKRNLDHDLQETGLTIHSANQLRVSDFNFEFVPKDDRGKCDEVKQFIERHEWLGKMPTRPTHRFIATYGGRIAGAIVMATPNTFSNLLGEEHRHKEKLISRGACISWSPKNLGSALVMFAIRWMVKNTEFRYFTAYSDVEARELGTIYQACNFIYLGQTSGARFQWVDSNDSEHRLLSDRLFRRASFIKRKALEVGLAWEPEWHQGERILWERIPQWDRFKIKEMVAAYQASCAKRALPFKHKYVCILGQNRSETKSLLSLFRQVNPDKINIPYPKNRGPVTLDNDKEESKKTEARPCRISHPPLTKRPIPCWPKKKEDVVPKKLYTIKEISTMSGVSLWLIYSHIKSDPTFPVVNAGLKKKFLIDPVRFERWLEQKTQKFILSEHGLLSSEQLLEAK